MFTKRKFAVLTAIVLVGGIVGPKTARAQDATDASLGDQLKAQYKIAKAGLDSNGWSIVQPGTVLVIQKGGIVGVPPANLTMAPATFKDGELHTPKGGLIFVGNNTRQLTVGEKVYVLKMDVHVKNDKVAFTIVECDSCNGVQQPSTYKSQVVFQFPKDYLAKADVSQVKDFVSQVLAADDQQQSQAQQQAAPAPTAQPAAATTQTIQLGQTPDQVKAAIGPPEKVVDLGAKQIYVYKDLKITFVNGKVADVQ